MSIVSSADVKIVQLGRDAFFLANEIQDFPTNVVAGAKPMPILIATEDDNKILGLAGVNRTAFTGIEVPADESFVEEGTLTDDQS